MKKFSDKRGSKKKKKKSKISRNYSILYVFSKVVMVMVVMAAAIYCAMVLFLEGVGGLGG